MHWSQATNQMTPTVAEIRQLPNIDAVFSESVREADWGYDVGSNVSVKLPIG